MRSASLALPPATSPVAFPAPSLAAPLASPRDVGPPRSPRVLAALLLALAALASWPVSAQGLYGPEAPQDVAFVRFVNATGEALEPTLDGAALAPLESGAASAYRTLEPGSHEAGAAGLEPVAFEAEPEGFVTVALVGGAARALEDAALRDISRGLLSFYNLAGAGPLTLRTGDGQEVFAAVEATTPGAPPPSLAVNRAEIGFEVLAEGGDMGEVLGALEPRLLERGVAHAVFALPPLEGEGVRVVYAASELEP